MRGSLKERLSLSLFSSFSTLLLPLSYPEVSWEIFFKVVFGNSLNFYTALETVLSVTSFRMVTRNEVSRPPLGNRQVFSRRSPALRYPKGKSEAKPLGPLSIEVTSL